ncbi:hypothetical protein F4820DRAFT_445237 [Hypoxylon rubiginosum]|uniref:Uncharacterized protein n=1 Tax=Hypoxylon rubiginosum TaxID=110542 RepID=A0ACB9ZAD6_9PEZI|nr:hypothetical protein F4820DRAFT_445237 [Hypoxylon rubiginosum]
MLSRTPRHFAPLRTLAVRCSAYAQQPTLATRLQQRFSSSQPQPPAPAPEGSLNASRLPTPLPLLHITKQTFGRPIAKVFLLAIFTYQLSYYFWVRAEQDEIRSEMRATIAALEARIEQLEKAK